ncbi:MAG: VanW family protein [Lachnospiraceae bacterium]
MKRKSLKYVVVALAIVCTIIGSAVLAGQFRVQAASEDKILEGVYIGGLSLGGMTRQEAQTATEEYVENLMTEPVVFQVSDRQVKALPEELGLACSEEDLAERAYSVGHLGNLIRRYKEQQDLKHENVILNVTMSVDRGLLEDFLEAHMDTLNKETINNGLKRENGKFIYVPGQAGEVVDLEASMDLLERYFSEEIIDSLGTVELISKVEEPKGTEEELGKVQDVLGSFETDYSTSAAGRCTNVENAASLINGTVLYPGDTFSVHDAISPITLENGYAMAGAYENGTVVESVGGGVCQVSSTLYNAVIRAELEIVERSPHSMVVSYVKPSQDAAIAGDYKDLKFKNNQDTPVYIEGYTAGKKVHFNVYGMETRDSNRSINFETEIKETDEPDIKFVKTDAPIGTVTKTQDAHVGYKAVLYKIVTVNGKEESREVFNRSTYSSSEAVYEVGTKSDSKEAVKAIKDAIKTGDLSEVTSAAKYWSDSAISKREEKEKQEKKNEGKNTTNNSGSNASKEEGQTSGAGEE